MPKNTHWDHNLSVTADGEGLIGHAGPCCCASSPTSAG